MAASTFAQANAFRRASDMPYDALLSYVAHVNTWRQFGEPSELSVEDWWDWWRPRWDRRNRSQMRRIVKARGWVPGNLTERISARPRRSRDHAAVARQAMPDEVV